MDDLYDDAEEGQEDTEDTAGPTTYGDKTAGEMGLSGVPGGNSDQLKSLLYQNLSKRLNEKSPMVDMSRDVAETNRNNSLMALLGKAASSMGTLGGKSADSSGLEDMAKSQNQANQVELGGYAEDDKRKAQLQQYLMGKLTQEGIAAKTAGWHEAKVSEDKRHHEAMEKKPNGGATASFSPAGQDADGNILVIDHRTGKVVSSGQQGSKLAGAPKGGSSGNDPKQWEKLNHDLTSGTASSRSDLGRQQATVTNSDRLLTLAEQGKLQKGGLDKRQIHEAAIASAALVGGGTGAAQSTIEALVPHSFGSTAAGIEEWLTSNPAGTEQQAFVERMMETAEREKHLANEKIRGIKNDVLQGYSHLKDADPERWQKTVAYNLGADAQFDEQGRYKPRAFQAKGHTDKPVSGQAMAATLAPTKSGYMPGSVVKVKGVPYTVGPDGDSLIPAGGQ